MIKIRQRQLVLWVALSALLHALLFLAPTTARIHEPTRIPVALVGSVTVQIAAARKNADDYARPKQAGLRQVGTGKTGITSHKDITQTHASDANISSEQTATSPSGRVKTSLDELQRLLLAKIDQHKHYPLSAIRLKQEGATRIGFRLRKSGHIDKLAITRSSGYRALDQAALSAINEIQPFKPADRLIRDVASLQIEIIFQL